MNSLKGRELMGTELSKVNIKENSLIVQLQELKSYMITKLDARFKELQTEVLKKVRVYNTYLFKMIETINLFCENSEDFN